MIAAFAFLAQVVAEAPQLVAFGPLGIFMGWALIRGEKLAGEIKRELADMKRTILLDVVSRDNTGPKAKELAQQMLAEIEARKK